MRPLADAALPRRDFLKGSAAAGVALSSAPLATAAPDAAAGKPEYRGPNTIIVRFGGGARRRESIDPRPTTYSPFLLHHLAPRGVLLKDMRIGSAAPDTGHGQGTLNILTGKYDKYRDVQEEILGERFEARVPTLFEHLRSAFDVPSHQALIVNGEDRTQEEFYTFSNHHLFGARFRSEVLSLYRFKTYLLRKQIASDGPNWSEATLASKRAELERMVALDYRRDDGADGCAEIDRFWDEWRREYGDSGLVNPRGDRLLTELAIQALTKLRPRLMMINYNDCDYVHWGNLAHYTRGIAIMDAGIRRLVRHVDADPEYRDNTLIVVVPDCGRDDSRLAAVPCQHHFNTRSSREIFAVVVGPGVDRGRVVDLPTQQIQIAPTVGHAMGFRTPHAEGSVIEEAFA